MRAGLTGMVLWGLTGAAVLAEAHPRYHRRSAIPRRHTATLNQPVRSFDRRQLRRQWPMFRLCHEQHAKGSPVLGTGTVVGHFIVDAKGLVISAKADAPSTAWRKVATCISRVLLNSRYAPDKSGGFVKVRYPIHFDDGRVNARAKPPAAGRLIELRKILTSGEKKASR